MEIIAMIDGGNGDLVEIGIWDDAFLVVRPHYTDAEAPWENLEGCPKFADRTSALQYVSDSYSGSEWDLRWLI